MNAGRDRDMAAEIPPAAGAEAQAGYDGDVSCEQAWRMLRGNPASMLVDVRTRAEWQFVGGPDLSSLGKEVIRVEWQGYPDGELIPDFPGRLRAALGGAGTGEAASEGELVFLFLCRSGQRSRAAAKATRAAAELAAGACYNIGEGFEGPLDSRGQRRVNGWKIAGLPWRQT